MHTKDLRVSVLMGGPSSEHDISLKSGRGVVAALTQRGWPASALVIPRELSVEEACRFTRVALERDGAQVAFLALHGAFGEDGTIQAVCDELGVAYTGSDQPASRLGLDKVASRIRFQEAGLRVPQWELIEDNAESRARVRRAWATPLVVKPTNQGSSLGVSIVTDATRLDAAMEEAARYDTRLLIEAFVPGREMTVGVLGDAALPVVEIKPTHQFFDYTAKYTAGETAYLVPAPLDSKTTARLQQAGLRAHRAAGCRDFSRVDLILNGADEPVVLEVNTIPGLTALSLLPKAAACAGISYDELCERVVEMARARGARHGVVHA